MEVNDTIVAVATPPGIGALAVIRVSGDNAFAIVNKHIREAGKFEDEQPQRIRLYHFIEKESNEVVDEITAVKYTAPRSFTGEDMVEIICHGGSVVPESILELLVDGGARYAGKGEFSRRAFCNGKTSLAKAESINQIVNSKTEVQHKSAIQSYLEGYQSLINGWRKQVEDILVEIESSIEFGENDDIEKRDSHTIIGKKIDGFKKNVLYELEKRSILKEIEHGIYIAIVGPVNAGKSSLLNLILGYERSIVDKKGGTTRDFISEKRIIENIPVTLVDTAGLKKKAQGIEKIGIERSKEFIKNSKIDIWVTAADEPLKEEEIEIEKMRTQKIVGVINKIDLADGKEKEGFFKKHSIPHIKISAIDINERKRVEHFIKLHSEEIYRGVQYDCVITNKRQEKIMESIINEIENIEKCGKQEEIKAEYCRNILNNFDEFVGKTTTEDVLDKIFNEFCIGK